MKNKPYRLEVGDLVKSKVSKTFGYVVSIKPESDIERMKLYIMVLTDDWGTSCYQSSYYDNDVVKVS